jgi:transcriptional regulator with XRE-family HTH domain
MATILDMRIGQKIEAWLDSRGWNASQLAEACDVSPSTVGRWLKHRRDPRRPELVRLAGVMGVSLDYLADDGIDEPPAPLVSQRIVDAIQAIGEDIAYRRLIGADTNASKPEPPIRPADVRVEVYETPASKRRTGR